MITTNPILAAFDRVDLAEDFDPTKHEIRVLVGQRHIATIAPTRDGCHEMAYVLPGMTPVGPAFDPAQMRSRLLRAVFGGNEGEFQTARLARVCHP